MHQVLITLSNEGSDVRCNVCGQGFLVYWARFSRAEQTECRRVIQEHLRQHHDENHGLQADRRKHPRDAFNIPDWTALPEFSIPESNPNLEDVA
jgi:hypothetical protein